MDVSKPQKSINWYFRNSVRVSNLIGIRNLFSISSRWVRWNIFRTYLVHKIQSPPRYDINTMIKSQYTYKYLITVKITMKLILLTESFMLWCQGCPNQVTKEVISIHFSVKIHRWLTILVQRNIKKIHRFL